MRASSCEKKFIIEGFNTAEPVRLSQDIVFLARLTQKCCFSLTTIVGALDILLRLYEKPSICFHASTWRSLLVTCLILSEKMWEDNFVHPMHIIGQYNTYCPGQFSHSKRDFLYMQLAIVEALEWRTNMNLTRYHSLVAAVMATEVPVCIYRVLSSQSQASLIPRPLPALPKMILPASQRRPPLVRTGSAASTTSSASTSGGTGLQTSCSVQRNTKVADLHN